MDGLLKIVAIKASMNNGLSNQLKESFPNLTPVLRPVIKDQEIPDPYWLAGFTSGEGSFVIRIEKSLTHLLGFQILLRFTLSQHYRDKQLMESLIKYLNCGNIEKVSTRSGIVTFVVYKFHDIFEKIIPFFQKYQIIGIKSEDFKDFFLVAYLMKEKKHLTKEGLDKIKKIKAGMNKGRS